VVVENIPVLYQQEQSKGYIITCFIQRLATNGDVRIYTPGWKNGKRSLATKCLDVPIATVKQGDPYAHIPRYMFEVMLGEVRAKRLTHADVVWLVLSYKYWRWRGKQDG
jgi:hypothetical protein